MKRKFISINIFYFLYFLASLLISFILLRGYFNPNISSIHSFLSIIGDLGVISLFFTIGLLVFKSNKKRIVYLVIVNFIFTLLSLFLNGFSYMFSCFFSYTQLISFKNPSQGALISEYVNYFSRMFGSGNFLIPTIIFVIFFIFSFFVKDENKEYSKKKNFIGLGVSYSFMLIPFLICLVHTKGTYNEISMNSFYGSSQMGVYNYYIHSVKDLFNKEIKLNDEQKVIIEDFLDDHEYVKETTVDLEGKNLIIIQMEAINNFVIDLKIDNELVAPYLTKLSKENYYNSRFYSGAGMGNTSDCEFSSLVGLYPNGNDLSIYAIEGDNYPSIAKEFNKKGYDTFSIHGNEGAFYNRINQHVNLFGFNKHIDKELLLNRNKDLELIKNWISDDALLDEAINIYLEKEKPFFSYNILVSSHSPFRVEGIERMNNEGLTSLANDYLSYVRYVDQCIENFIERLKNERLYDDSIIMIYGDHTSSLLRNDLKSIQNKYLSDIEYKLTMQNVPFILIGEEISAFNDKSCHTNIDIFPTLANLFNLSPDYTFGVDMLSKDNTFVYNPRSLDIIYNDYVIMSLSKEVYYLKEDSKKLSEEEIDRAIEEFSKYKYSNDLLVASNYFN